MNQKIIARKNVFSNFNDNIVRLFGIFVALIIVIGVVKPEFLSLANFQTITSQLVVIGLLSLSNGICMISGGIDLSIVYIANLSAILSGLYLQKHVTDGMSAGAEGLCILVTILIALAVGTLCGILNGILVSYLRVPAMLATLGSFELFYGLGIVFSNGSSISDIPGSFSDFGTAMVFDTIPLPFFVFLAVAILFWFGMSKTKFGHRVYLVGTNLKASTFAGIKTNLILIRVYMLSGIIAAVAGLINLSNLNSAKADFGTSYTMQSILVAVLGGVDPNGGFGSIGGIVIAVFILQMLSSFLNMFPSISNFYRDLIWGVALIAVLIMNFVVTKRKIAKQSKA